MPALAPNSLITITGITGYIGSYVGLAALQDGHRIRGTVRSLQRAESLRSAYTELGFKDINERLEFMVIDGLLSADQWQRAIEGVDGVVNVAAPLELFGDRSFVDKAVDATVSLLEAAKRVSSVKRVVITSSAAAVISAPVYRDKVLTDEDWNDDAVRIIENEEPTDKDDATHRAPPGFVLYAAGKAKAEKAAWDFIRDKKPQFDLVSTLPYTNFGPALYGDPPSTARWMARLLKNDATLARVIPPQWFVDVRDVGRLHVLSLTTPSLGGKRLWAAAEPWGWNAILSVLRKHFPNMQVPEDIEGRQGELDPQKIDNKVATDLLGGWIDLETSVVDFAKSMGY